MGPLSIGENLLVTIDYYNQYVEVAILKDISAKIYNNNKRQII